MMNDYEGYAFFVGIFTWLCLSYFALGILVVVLVCFSFFVFSLVLLRMAGWMRCTGCSLSVRVPMLKISISFRGCGSEEVLC